MNPLIKKLQQHGPAESMKILAHKTKLKYRILRIKKGRYNIAYTSSLAAKSFSLLTAYINKTKITSFIHPGIHIYPDVSNNFSLLGKEFSFGEKINWQFLSCDTAKSYPYLCAPAIKTMDYGKYGDYRITWELNRHHHLVWLAQAYTLAKSEVYINKIKSDLNDWAENNIGGHGINYVSPMEISIRLLNWLTSAIICGDSEIFNKKIVCSIIDQCFYLNDNSFIKTRRFRNNHSIVELAALIILQSILNSSRLPKLDSLYELLFKELAQQFYNDGCNFEHSPTYSRLTLEALVLVLLFEKSSAGFQYRRFLSQKLHKYANALRLFLTPHNKVPLFSDSDNGRMLFLGGHNKDFNDFRGFFDFLALYFRDDSLFASHGTSELENETRWWCILARVDIPEQINRPKLPINCILSDGGYFIYSEPKLFLAFKAGYPGNKLLKEEYAPHVHQDLLSFECYLNNEPILVDSGTYTYDPTDNGFRDYFRSASAHNVIVVNKSPQFNFSGAFGANTFPEVRISATGHREVLGEVKYENGINVKRSMGITTNGIYAGDTVESSSPVKESDIYFNLHPDIYILDINLKTKIITLKSKTSRVYLLRLSNDTRFNISVINGWYSESYNCKKANKVIVISLPGIEKAFSFKWSLEYSEIN